MATAIGSFDPNRFPVEWSESQENLTLTKKVDLLYTALKSKASEEEFSKLNTFLAKREQGGQLVVASQNLFAQDVPPISQKVVDDTLAYTDFRSTTIAAAHPTSSEIIISTRPFDGKNMQLFTMNEAGGKLTQITFCERSVTEASYQPTHGNYCIFSTDSANGREQYQLYRYDFTGEPVLITDGKSRNRMGAWSNDGNQYAYTSSRRNGKDQDLYIINPAFPETDKLVKEFSGGDQWNLCGWSADDSEILFNEELSASFTNLWVVKIADGSKRLLNISSSDEEVLYDYPRFSPDGKNLFFITDKDREFKDLVRVDLATGKPHFLTGGGACDIDFYRINPRNSSQLFYLANENGYDVVHLLTLLDEGVEDIIIPNMPKGILNNIVWGIAGQSLRFSVNSATVPLDVFSIDLTTFELTRWTETPSSLDAKQFSEPELISWRSFDGSMIEGFLYLPKKKKEKFAVQVIVHGGPELQSRPGFLGRFNYYLNELGIALIYPNIRGSTGYGKTFLTAANGMNRVDAYQDIDGLLDWIKQQPNLDGDRIMVSGGSYGGHVALAVATLYNDKIKCSLSSVGISNLVTFLENTDPRRQDLRRSIYGDERVPEMRAFLESIAPVNHVKKITKPVFIIQGREDSRVPYTESIQMVDSLKGMGRQVLYLMGMNEGHGFGQKDNADFQFHATIMFIDNHLIGKQQDAFL